MKDLIDEAERAIDYVGENPELLRAMLVHMKECSKCSRLHYELTVQCFQHLKESGSMPEFNRITEE